MVELKVDDDVLVGRIAQRRADSPPRPDNHAATLKNRLLIYHRTAAPLIAGKFISVDSMAPIPDVRDAIGRATA